ncbi:MAG: S1 RNA-binding domain-containing protein, partial [Clostridia bacterium]|nr:S1 RNA-binding domain-containing protein [Clostridia bacterium]
EKVEMRRRQIVASQRVILEAEKAERDAIKAEKLEAFFNSIQVGDVVTGTPVRFAEFGAFVQVNGFDCLAHVSDLAWNGCSNPADVLELNKEYQFKILKIDADKQKVSIGYKQLQPKPWELVNEKYSVGDVINGKVVRIVSFGAFVEVEKGIDGLVHVSQISNKWLENPLTSLEVGQIVEAKIIAIDADKEKMNLSIKALLPEEPKPEKKEVVEKVEVVEEPELKEWIDDNTGSISIADLVGKLDD